MSPQGIIGYTSQVNSVKRTATFSRRRCVSALLLVLASPAIGQVTARGFNNVSASVATSGAWSLSVPSTGWQFAGTLGANALVPHINSATDNLGAYQEVAFAYSIGSSSRAASIRIYSARPLVLFSVTYNNAASNASPFPTISSYPALSHLSFSGEFSSPEFVNLVSDSPWAYFDSSLNTYILSAASDYMTAANTVNSKNAIAAGIDSQITSLPAGFTHKTALVFGQGINNTFTLWGQAITDLGNKQRPANNADALLTDISYWTDNGAAYYYNPGAVSYMSTLDAVRTEFASKGVKLGSLQLDSWWYPKGPDNSWSDGSGIWTYTAAPDLFQPDLATFQTGLGVPLITHARWIDANSPYRSQYAISNNVATDPAYWEAVGTYLKSSGASVYEQDWLGDNAQTNFNLTDPYAFLGNMAASMASRGINIQYCMAEPKHFLQSTNYSNVTTIRASQDRFGANRWTSFFYSSRFASAIGLWPYADVFMSTETTNMIASVLSAGPVGLGDALGNLSKTNLSRAARADGVLVKPDVSATPVDSVFVNDAAGVDVPMVAGAWTDFGNGLRANYIFAYPRAANNILTIDPSTYGITGASYLYNYLAGSGAYIAANTVYTTTLPEGGSYFVLMPAGPSGIAFLGDRGQFVTLGRQRIASLVDGGSLDVTVNFAPGETSRTLFGYSPQAVEVASVAGGHRAPSWNEATQMFTVVVHPSAAGTAEVHIAALPQGSIPVACAIRCAQ